VRMASLFIRTSILLLLLLGKRFLATVSGWFGRLPDKEGGGNRSFATSEYQLCFIGRNQFF